MRFFRRYRLTRPAAIGLAALAVLVLAGLLFLTSANGRGFVVRAAARALTSERAQIRYGALGGDWPQSLVIDDLLVSDREGPWLEARRISIALRPLDLLRGRLTMKSLVIQEPVMRRVPESADRDGGNEIRLPVDLVLKTFRLSEGRIGALGEARFSAEGAVTLKAHEKSLRLNAERTDSVGEHIMLSALWRAAPRELSLDLDAVTTEGGVMAALFEWPGAPACTLKAKGEGPVSDWRLGFNGDCGNAGALELESRLVWTKTMELRFRGGASLGVPFGSWRDAFGDALTFEGLYTRSDARELSELRVRADGARGNLMMTRAAPDYIGRRALSGSAVLRLERSISLGGGRYHIGKSSLEAALGGTDTEPAANVRLAISNIGTQAHKVSALEGALALALRTLPTGRALTFDGEGSAFGLAHLTDKAHWSLSGHYGLKGAESALTRLAVEAQDLSVKASGVVRQWASQVEAQLVAKDLQPLSAVVGVALSGSGSLDAHARRGAADTPWTIAISGAIENSAVDDVPLAPFAGERLTLRARADLDARGQLDIRSAELAGAHVRGQAQGRLLPALALKAEIETDLSAIGTVADFVAAGPVTMRLDAQGALGAPRISLAAESPHALIEGLDLGELALSLEPRSAELFPVGLLRLRSKSQAGSGDISAPLGRDGKGGFTLDPLQGFAFGAAIEGALALSKDDLFTGHIDARFASLGPFFALVLGEGLGGEGRGHARVDFAAKPSVEAAIEASAVALSDVVTANVLKGSYRRVDHADVLVLEARDGTLALLGSKPLDFGSVSLAMEGPSGARAIVVDAQALSDAHGTLKLSGMLNGVASARQLALAALDANLWSIPVRLTAPTKVVRSERGFSLAPTRLAIGDGEALFRLGRTARSLELDLELKKAPVALAGAWLGLDWPRGAIDGTLTLSTLPAQPKGTLSLHIADVLSESQAPDAAAPLTGFVSGTWNGRALTLEGELSSPDAGHAVLNGRLPLRADREGRLAFDSSGALEGDAHWRGRVSSLWTLLPLDNHRLDGDGELTLAASGTWRAPRLDGSLKLTQGGYDNLITGTRLVGLNLEATATADAVQISAAASDGDHGALKGQGTIRLAADRGYPLDATLDFTRFRIVGLDSISATASGTATLSGPMRDLTLQGALSLERVDATIPDRLPAEAASLPVTYVGLEGEGAPLPELAVEKEAAVSLDVKIGSPGRAYLRGRGLNTEWAGKLAVAGTTAAPRITGEIGLVRGTLDFSGNVFDLSRGRIVFQGGEKIDPELDVAATRMVRGTEVALTVTGPVSGPKLEIRSVPALPQDEAVALLLFGKPPGALSAFELVQVAQGVATLTGMGRIGGVSLLGRAREALGLDVLSVGVGQMGATSVSSASALTEGTTISAGRRLSKGVYVGVTQGMSAASGTVEIDIQVTPHISVKSELGEASGGVAGLDWKWDY